MQERLIDRVREHARKEYQLDENYFKEVYLRDNFGCMPEEHIGDDLLVAVSNKFYHLIGSVRDLIDKDLREKGKLSERECAQVYICPSYEDCSSVLVIFKKHLVYSEHRKAWHYSWHNEEEMEQYLQQVYQILSKNMEVVIDGRDPE